MRSQSELIEALRDARALELRLFEGLAPDQLLGRPAHFLEPPIWEVGHVGWFQEYWLLRHLDGQAPLRDGFDSLYDAFHVPYRRRWALSYPDRATTLAYVAEVLERSIARLGSREPTEREAYFYTLCAQHEDMHAENLTLILQTLGFARPPPSRLRPPPTVDPGDRPRDVCFAGGSWQLGATREEPFVFDNEKWAHPVEVLPFRIASTPVTNAEYRDFVADRGYERRELWSRRGWQWLRRDGAGHPLYWERRDGAWYERVFEALAPLAEWHPVVGINWHETQAYCRWAGRRLPTEAEWEMAAAHEPQANRERRWPWGDEPPGPERANLDHAYGWVVDVRALAAGDSACGCRQMIGNVWEWVEDTFQPFPGFECDPYREYSAPYFGQKKVLRGGSWATRSRVARTGYRNFFKEHRRNLFAGFRTCASLAGGRRGRGAP